MSFASAMKVTGLSDGSAIVLEAVDTDAEPMWIHKYRSSRLIVDRLITAGYLRFDAIAGRGYYLTDTGQAVLDEWRQEVSR